MLPSQTARSAGSRSHMYRRGKHRPWLLIGVVALVIIGTVLMVRWLGGKADPAGADAGTTDLQGETQPLTRPEPEAQVSQSAHVEPPPMPARPSPRTEPEKLTMGGARDATNAPVHSSRESSSQRPSPLEPRTVATPTSGSTPKSAGAAQSPDPRMAAAPPSQRVQMGLTLLKENKPVEARRVLSEALVSGRLSESEAEQVRSELTKVNERLVFSPEVVSGDPFVGQHMIASGESLAKLPRKLGLHVDWRFLQRVNQLSDPTRIRIGQRLKVVKGPFHAIVDKRTFRLDLYMGDGSDRVYVRSFLVGLGEDGATPEGAFAVKPDSKLINPAWTNPRTGEYFQPEDPKNPLGEYWIGLVGASDNIRGLETYGIHGTIDPTSIGKEMSMGCVRLRDEDIKLLYEVLTEQGSRIEIHGNDWP